ncbi:hypothetical protein JY452_04580 [Stenotrophomonas maltophilia]|uniref:hypothetical protein n=1 Tax=Stenotrophomonas TaxID=40323 RepID=UPI0006C244E7|nr:MULTISPECIES: hypothetical protein [Stenotrophomonas]ECH9271578.1 hypothetical protein [Salmonella enterica subsp. enterica serovar Litchfield]KOO80428.1 hypothetical protein VO93_18390 [Stenotrophomonas maltophilia]MBN5125283.1 hypothetical protein [Stenotrophomonas maltophilia]MBN5175653.1 hypothetical protein [Stenotrophomonas maltophilia]MCU1120982.1 hypothetical protein [Stenotrophomonas maltophilia]
MTALPSVARVMFEGQKRTFDPSVLRTEMERGAPKQRLENSQVLIKQAMTLYFASIADVNTFDAWYFGEIKRIGWFTLVHPYTGEVITARFENGALGDLVPEEKLPEDYRMDVVVEYMR